MEENTLEKDKTLPDGLTSGEAARLCAEGKVNRVNEKAGKSYGKIICDNFLTFFNLLYAIISVILVAIGSIDNLTFLAVVLPNVLIAIILEVKAKRTVEKLSVTTDPKATVVRDGRQVQIDASEIVIGDVMQISAGRQILSDAVVISGMAEANESMLTGESNAIKKTEGERLLAGSYLVSGAVFARVTAVGRDNYVHKIESAAKGFKAPASNLFCDLNRLIKYIGIILLPIALLMAVTNYFAYERNVIDAIAKTCGSIIGMIPAGMYLLVTVTLTLSVIKLSRKQTLVQDMYSIEMLAAADVLCLDKTGTITDGTMCVTGLKSLDGTDECEIARIISIIEGAEDGENNTSRALSERFGRKTSTIVDKIPFSSERKFSAVEVEGEGAFAIGAPHFVPCPVSEELEEEIRKHAALGERVLIVARLPKLDTVGTPLAIVAISDRIRPNAKDTIEGFQSQGVAVKIISGDHAATVSTIAGKVGVIGYENYLSCENLSDEELSAVADKYTVFGRVTPEQKVLLVKTFKAEGHTVAMTGDGVNDTLALKESNCAIAMAEGSEMACKVSQIVLLDSDFARLPDVVREGRRCINNVRGSASLFLMKTMFVICLSLFSVFTLIPFFAGAMEAPSGYPFEPKQFMLLELFVIGIASVLLALEPNNKRIEGSFIKTVLVKSAPSAVVMFLPVLVILLTCMLVGGISNACRNSVAMIAVTLIGYVNLFAICRPFTKWRAAVVGIIGAALVLAVPLGLLLGDMFGFLPAIENVGFFLGMTAAGLALSLLLQLFRAAIENFIFRLIDGRAAKNKK